MKAKENGQQAAAIAEIILVKTHEFCQLSIEDLFARDSKLKSLVDQATENLENTSKDDYQGGISLKSSITQPRKKLNRGSSVTSLYSQEKERKSVSIRRSKSKVQSQRGRDSSLAGLSDDTTKSLERMYTFNLSRVSKQANAKAKGGANDKGNPSAIDIRPVDMQAKDPAQVDRIAKSSKGPVARDSAEEESKEPDGERTTS